MRWVHSVWIVLCVATPAWAALDPALATVDIKLDTSESMGTHPEWDSHLDVAGTSTSPVFASISQDVTSPYINGSPPSVGVYEMIAVAEVAAGPGVGNASVRGSSTHVSGFLRNTDPRITASASVEYSAGVVARRPSPLSYRPPIFVSVSAHGSASATHDSSVGLSRADVAVAISGGNISGTYRQARTAIAFVGPTSLSTVTVDLDFTLRVRLDDEFSFLNISKGVSGEIRTGTSLASHEFQASVDPIVTFDQAAFDAYAVEQGFATFPLEEYFALEFSPGIMPVPEPTSIAGLLLVCAVATRHRRT